MKLYRKTGSTAVYMISRSVFGFHFLFGAQHHTLSPLAAYEMCCNTSWTRIVEANAASSHFGGNKWMMSFGEWWPTAKLMQKLHACVPNKCAISHYTFTLFSKIDWTNADAEKISDGREVIAHESMIHQKIELKQFRYYFHEVFYSNHFPSRTQDEYNFLSYLRWLKSIHSVK